MRKWSVAVWVGTLAIVAGCGDSASDQDKLADQLVESANSDDDVVLDEDCLRQLAAQFTDDDAEQLLDNLEDLSQAEVSPDGEQLMFEMFNCATLTELEVSSVDSATLDDAAVEQLIDGYVANIPDNVDPDCFREILTAADPAQLASGGAPELISGISACLTTG